MTRSMCWAAAVTCLVGCATSAALHYYTLSQVAPTSRLTAGSDVVAVQLERVSIPPELDRAQFVRKVDDTRVKIVEDHRWAAPLEDMLRRVLSEDLTARLPPNLIVDPNESSAGERHQSLTIDIHELYGDEACGVTLRAGWMLKGPEPAQQDQTRRGDEEVRISPSGACPGPERIPAAMNQAIAQLSDRIAAAIVGAPGR